MATNVIPSVRTEPKIVNRWVQMCAGIVAMMAIANLQYAWTLFTKPLTSSLHTTLAAVQIAFAAFIFCETWLVPFEGYLIDRLGPRLVIGIGGLLVGAGWIGSGYSYTTTGLYIWYAVFCLKKKKKFSERDTPLANITRSASMSCKSHTE